MRSIGKRNIKLVITEVEKELKRQQAYPSIRLRYIDYRVAEENVIAALPEAMWDTWEMADQEIRSLVDDMLNSHASGKGE